MTRARSTLAGVALFAAGAGLFALLRPPAPPPLRVGAPAPDFRLVQLHAVGEGADAPGTAGLGEYRGRVVFLNFWATWCPPCRDEAPSLDRLYRAFRNRGFEVLAVSIDSAEALESVRTFRGELGLSFPILLDPSQRVYTAYQSTGVPETFVIDPEGRIVERVVGPRDWDHPRYAALVERLLPARPRARKES